MARDILSYLCKTIDCHPDCVKRLTLRLHYHNLNCNVLPCLLLLGQRSEHSKHQMSRMLRLLRTVTFPFVQIITLCKHLAAIPLTEMIENLFSSQVPCQVCIMVYPYQAQMTYNSVWYIEVPPTAYHSFFLGTLCNCDIF